MPSRRVVVFKSVKSVQFLVDSLLVGKACFQLSFAACTCADRSVLEFVTVLGEAKQGRELAGQGRKLSHEIFMSWFESLRKF